jgi:hypothetical protein
MPKQPARAVESEQISSLLVSRDGSHRLRHVVSPPATMLFFETQLRRLHHAAFAFRWRVL